MGVVVASSGSQFSERVLQLLQRVEHRVACTASEKEAAYGLRYEAYIRNELIDARQDGLLYDAGYDDSPNSWIVGTYIDGELVATVRINLAVGADGGLPSLRVFGDVISPHLRAGRTVVDFTRAAARLEASRRFPELPYIALRPGYMAAEHFDIDFAIATTRAEHMAFYRRVFQFSAWSEARSYPNVAPKIVCLGMDFQALRDAVLARYPFFRSTAAERTALFGLGSGPADARSGARHEHWEFEARASA